MKFINTIKYMLSCGIQSGVFVTVAITFTLIAWMERIVRYRVEATKNKLNRKRLSPAGQIPIERIAMEKKRYAPSRNNPLGVVGVTESSELTTARPCCANGSAKR